MRQLTTELVRELRPPLGEEEVILLIGQALTRVRGRPVRLRRLPFPPGVASGVWVYRERHDLIGYEQNTDLEHQLVIIGHEAWHMLQGHCSSSTAHGPTAARSGRGEEGDALLQLVAAIAEADGSECSPAALQDIPHHFAARTNEHADEEREAELFGILFGTFALTALTKVRTPEDPYNLADRIQASMAHQVRPN